MEFMGGPFLYQSRLTRFYLEKAFKAMRRQNRSVSTRLLDFASEAFKKIVRAGRYYTRSFRRTDRLRVGHLVNVVCMADRT